MGHLFFLGSLLGPYFIKDGFLLGPYSYAHRSTKDFNTVLFTNEAITQGGVWVIPPLRLFINDVITYRGEGGSQKVTNDDEGEGGVSAPPKNDDVIYEQSLIKSQTKWILEGGQLTFSSTLKFCIL